MWLPLTPLLFAAVMLLAAPRRMRRCRVGISLIAVALSAAWILAGDFESRRTPAADATSDSATAHVAEEQAAAELWQRRLVHRNRLWQLGVLGIGTLWLMAVLPAPASPTPTTTLGWLLLALWGIAVAGTSGELLVFWIAVQAALAPLLLLFGHAFHRAGRRSLQEATPIHLAASVVALLGAALWAYLQGDGRLSIPNAPPESSRSATEQTRRTAVRDASATSYRESARPSPARMTAVVMILAGFGALAGVAPFRIGRLPRLLTPTDLGPASNTADGITMPGNVPTSTAHTLRHPSPGLAAAWLVIPALAVLPTLVLFVGRITGPERHATATLLVVVAAAGMVIGPVLAWRETDLMRRMAALWTAHLGYVMAAVAAVPARLADPASTVRAASGIPSAGACAVFALGVDVVALTGWFALSAYLQGRRRRLAQLDDFAGVLRHEPAAALAGAACLLTLAGLPPLPGFWSRLFLLMRLLEVRRDPTLLAGMEPHPAFQLLALLAAGGFVLTAVMHLRVVGTLLFAPARGRPPSQGGPAAWSAAVLAALGLLGVGFVPGPVLDAADLWSVPPARSAASEMPQTSRTPQQPPLARACRVAYAGRVHGPLCEAVPFGMVRPFEQPSVQGDCRGDDSSGPAPCCVSCRMGWAD